MKRLFTFASTLLLFASMGLAQTGGDKSKTELNPQPLPPGRHATATKSKKAHKGGKKSKKGSGTNTGTTTPK
jgi:hypothetical protein